MYSSNASFRGSKKELTKADIQELHYICPIENLSSIFEHGILSHKRAKKIRGHIDISNSEVQKRREKVKVERTDTTKSKLALHRHVNFYINAHNPMMFVKKDKHEKLCVLRIRPQILDRGDAMSSSRNAAADEAKFFPVTEAPLFSPQSTSCITCPKTKCYDKKTKQVRQAEALFPYKVDQSHIGGIFVSCATSKQEVENILREKSKCLPVTVHPSMFFQSKRKDISVESPPPLAPLTEEEQKALPRNLPTSSSDSESSDNEQKNTTSHFSRSVRK